MTKYKSASKKVKVANKTSCSVQTSTSRHKIWPLGPKSSNLEDSNKQSYEIASFSEMTKYNRAAKKLSVANTICPENSKDQLLDIKSWP